MTTLPLPSILGAVIRAVPEVMPLLSADAIKAAGYDGIRLVMRADIWGAIFGYLSGGSLSDTNSRMATAVAKGYIETLDLAYVEGGGETPVDEETAAWAKAELDAQLAFVDQLFDDLKQIRKDGDFDATAIANLRADNYASALDGFAAEAKMRGSKNVMLTWHLGATEKHCKTCASLDGQSHKISWYIDRDYIPRKSGCALDCGGWNCDCTLTDKSGNEYTM